MFPKGTMTAVVKLAEKPPVTAQTESTVVHMVGNTDSQADAVKESYWRTQRARICACAVVLTTLILVAGTLGGIAIVLTRTNGVETVDPRPSLNQDREPLLSNEVPLPKLPESTIRIKIDDGGLFPPTEPATPDPVAIDYVTDHVDELLPTNSLSSIDEGLQSSSDPSHISSSQGIPLCPSKLPSETDVEVSGDNQENDYGSGEPDLSGNEPSAPSPETDPTYPPSSISSNAYNWRSHASDGIVPYSSLDWYDYNSSY